MLSNYIQRLKRLLEQFEMSQDVKVDILNDYKQMIEAGQEKGMSDENILNLIGSPEKIYDDLKDTYKVKKKIKHGEKYIAISPFIALIIFMVFGFLYKAWHPAWMAFLLTPMIAITVTMINEEEQHLLTALSPFFSIIVFFLIGFLYGAWHPAWLVFMSIPIAGVFNSRKEMGKLEFILVQTLFLSVVAYIIVGYYTGIYHPTWLMLLAFIPFAILTEKNTLEKIVLMSSFFLSVGLYLWIGYSFDAWMVALIAFIIFIIPAIYYKHITIVDADTKRPFNYLVLITFTALFFITGEMYNAYALSWLFFLLIPVIFILTYDLKKPTWLFKANEDQGRLKNKLTATSPFISTALFYFVGYQFDLWVISWLFFLLIPIIAILED